ncbi:MAG: Crp/Fnr family transcriptional regulator [Blastocatellia bacterium]|nr:Crp/Fnr family transcriptional regulator [Blastocatellia bacterium]
MWDLLLRNISQHVKLSPQEIEIFKSWFSFKTLKRHNYFLCQGDICTHQAYVIRGCLSVFNTDEKGREHILQFAMENSWTADLYSFLTKTPSRYSIECLEDTELLLIERDSLENLYQQCSSVERLFRILFQNAYVASQKRIIDQLSLSAQERYQEFLKNHPQLERRISSYKIASYLGITPEAFSRLRKNMKDKKF